MKLEYPEDIGKIQAALAKSGYIRTARQTRILWEQYSEGYDAGWLSIDGMTDEQIISELQKSKLL
jgi:hypothetical protein